MKRGRQASPRVAGTTTARPMVAIVGRPNVGKSTLFNRLARQKLAIVEDVEGVTRDRHYADAFVLGREYVLIDTGGFDPDSDDPMKEGIAGHVELALEECDIVICAFDGSVDPTSADLEAVKLLRGTDKPVLYVANKADSEKQAAQAANGAAAEVIQVRPCRPPHTPDTQRKNTHARPPPPAHRACA